MIDLHCHILPGVDDGPNSLGESLELARLAALDGITDIVATPHNHRALQIRRTDVIPRVESLNSELRKEGIPLRIWPGAENQLDDLARFRAWCEAGDLCHLGDRPDFLLVEWPWDERRHPGRAEEVEILRWLIERGTTPIIAHPERHTFFRANLSRLEKLTQTGAWIQITAASPLGHHGRDPQNASRALLERFPNVVFATDSHGLSRRSGLRESYDWLEKEFGKERADDLRNRAGCVLRALQKN